ncbi:Transcription elongation factor, mitochondrial [Melipona quadrifasciata]|uniref:Transcription elongation factor, mitochondrial n=1 Tax=Melipona quadrifasciata TaxID=166423 RepID=A0A0M9A7R6_9HYME|nr:Transcription elongation factor, mitochondrial [Melipona quadrifasciata]
MRQELIMLRTLYKFTYTFKIKKNLWIQPLKICSIMTESNSENNVKFLKSESSILQLINTSGLKQLSKFIEASHAKTIISIRKENGLYKSLNDLSLSTKINNDILAKFYQSISNCEISTRTWSKYMTPDEIIMPATTLAIHVGPSAINWTVVNSDFKILDWDSRVWQNGTSKITTYDTINLIASITQQLPVCNCYVMEEIKMITNKSSNLLTQKQISTGIASCLKLITNQGTNNSPKNRLYLLKSFASARYFHLMIGSEAISANYIMKKILSDTDVNNEILQRVNVDEKLKRKYNEMFTDEKEQIGWSLLKALTFMCIIDTYNKYV